MNIIDDSASILQEINMSHPKIVGIDGIDGLGKTQLAKDVEKLGYIRISLDNYLKKNSGEYFNYIKYENLKKILEINKGKLLVIEGVLLQKILEKVPIKIDYLIYITDNAWIYDWSEEFEGRHATMALEDIIKEEEDIINRIIKIDNPNAPKHKMEGLHREIYEYTYHYKPWKNAQIILRRD